MRLPGQCWRSWLWCTLGLAIVWIGRGLGPADLRAGLPHVAKQTSDPAVKAAVALYEGIRVATLPNGLRVYLKPVPQSPVVTTMVAYKVGSCDEDLDHTGLSHYLEHLMFKGTDKIKPGDIDRLTLRNGGGNNASTSEDMTLYYFDFAADRWEAALEIEADRMRNLRIDSKHEFEQEKGAVIQELQRDEDQPWDLEEKAILPLLFGKTEPYGHPVIGVRQHVRGATAAVIKAHYDKWYHPNNAALVVCGGFDPDRAMAKIRQLFGPIPKQDLPKRKPVHVPTRRTSVRLEMDSRFDVPRMLMGFNTVRTAEPDYYPLEVVQEILSGGKTSRLYKKLVEGEQLADSVRSSNSTGRYPGWFSVQLQLLKDKDRKQAENLVLEELKRLRDEPVSPAELKRVQRSLLASFIFEQESIHNLADSIARGVTTNDLDFLKSYLSRIQAVTAADVQRVARKYLNPDQRVVVWSVPRRGQGRGVGSVERKEGEKKRKRDREAAHGEPNNSTAFLAARFGSPGWPAPGRSSWFRAADAAGIKAFSLKRVRRVVLDNGLTLLLLENHRLPIFVADAYVRDVRLLEPAEKVGVATLTGRLLDEGTARHTGPQIAELIEDVGGSLAFTAAGGVVRVLSPDRGLGLGLLLECLTQPSFPKAALARERARLLSEIADAEKEPDMRALLTYRALVYGPHPLGRPPLGRQQTVAALTPADCRTFHSRLFVPNNTIMALAGDFDTDAMVAEITRLTGAWKQADVAKPELPKIHRPKTFTQKFITMPDAAQLHFFMGQVGIRRTNSDYYKLLVMDYVLGTGPGFTDRLSSRLRDRQGLAYTVEANITRSATEEPGLFTCYIGTDPEYLARVQKAFLQELQRIRKEIPQRSEVEDAKKYLLGSLAFQYTTNARIASQLLLIERYKLGFGYLDDFRKKVTAVTPEDVRTVARQYLDPQRLVLVAAGAINQNGTPITPLPAPAGANKKE